MQFSCNHVSFTYNGSYTPVFEDLTFRADTTWRLGLTGRNGRGKTTLLRLLSGAEQPDTGRIDLPCAPRYFPYPVTDEHLPTRQAILDAAPTVQAWQLERECALLGLRENVLDRPYCTLSHGEQTKALLAALFACDDAYPLIDEPTNHLDLQGRAQVAAYLKRKDGFLLVSHDRAFLNACIDHVLSLNRSDVWVMQGTYDTWEARLQQQTNHEQNQNDVLQKEIRRMTEAARRTAQWSEKVESTKIGQHAYDRGAIGAQAAAMMKRTRATQKRQERAMEEKSALLHNVERVGELKLTTLPFPKEVLLTLEDAQVRYGTQVVAEHINLVLRRGERVALTGGNGAGKSSVLKALCGLGHALEGHVQVTAGLIISYVPQETDVLLGSMRAFIRQSGVDETLFKAILRNMDFTREVFDHSLEGMSQGQRKKLLLARSLCTPAHLYVWDEPLNYIDVFSRKQLEELILRFSPTLLMVEHDRVFLNRVCTRQIPIGKG